MCVAISLSWLRQHQSKTLDPLGKVLEVFDGFKATREQKQKDQRDGRRAAAGDQAIIVVKPCTSREVSMDEDK